MNATLGHAPTLVSREALCLCSENAPDLLAERGKRRSRDRVRSDGLVDVKNDALLILGIKLCSEHAGRLCSPCTAGDLEVDALGVVLGATNRLYNVFVSRDYQIKGRERGLTSTVQSNDLMTENIATTLDVLGDSDGAGEVVGDQVVSGPCSRDCVVVDEALGLDLEELEAAGLDLCAITWASSEVVDDGAVMGVRPGVPLEVNGITSCDSDEGLASRGTLVAGNVLISIFCRGNETVILIQCLPACGLYTISAL